MIDVPVIAYFPTNFLAVPPPKIRASLEKIIFWDPREKGYQPCEFRLILKNLRIWSLFSPFFAIKHTTEQ